MGAECYCYDRGMGGMDAVRVDGVCSVKERGERRIENGTFLCCLCRTENSCACGCCCCIFGDVARDMVGVDGAVFVYDVLLVWRRMSLRRMSLRRMRRKRRKRRKKGKEARMKREE